MQNHNSVLLNEVIENLEIKDNGIYVDLTLGRAGHASQILKKIPHGFLIGIDKDVEALNQSDTLLKQISDNYVLVNEDFSNLEKILKDKDISQVDGIIADLGVSSPQIDNAQRGFSYSKDAILDMRMNQCQDLDAHKIVNDYSYEQLKEIFKRNSEINNYSQIAKIIVENRPIDSTFKLVEVIKDNLPAFILRKKNPAKAIFQAIRIEVNNELESLKKILISALGLLKPGGKLAIITFHSIEDRIVKEFFGSLIKNKELSYLPIQEEKKYVVKTIKPSKEEIENNNRARSAKLRVLTKKI